AEGQARTSGAEPSPQSTDNVSSRFGLWGSTVSCSAESCRSKDVAIVAETISGRSSGPGVVESAAPSENDAISMNSGVPGESPSVSVPGRRKSVALSSERSSRRSNWRRRECRRTTFWRRFDWQGLSLLNQLRIRENIELFFRVTNDAAETRGRRMAGKKQGRCR